MKKCEVISKLILYEIFITVISNRNADPRRPDQPKRKGHTCMLLIDPAMIVLEHETKVTLPRRPDELHFYDVTVEGAPAHTFRVSIERITWNHNLTSTTCFRHRRFQLSKFENYSMLSTLEATYLKIEL